MRRLGIAFAALFLAATALTGPTSTAEEPAATRVPAEMLLARLMQTPAAPQCLPATDGGQCGPTAQRLAAGAECPAASGAYCSDELPYCCGTPGNYYCAKDVNSC